MADIDLKFIGQIDRRNPQNEGDFENPMMRENFLARGGRLTRPAGTEKAISTTLDDIPRWADRYYSSESGVVSPKSFTYTQDGKIWVIDDSLKTATEVESLLKQNTVTGR